MEGIKTTLIEGIVTFIQDLGEEVKGDPVNNPEDLEAFRNQRFMDDFDLDSLDMVELVMWIEDELEEELPDEIFETDTETMDTITVGKFIDNVQAHLNKVRIA